MFPLYCYEMLKTNTTKKMQSYSFDVSHSVLCDTVPVYFLHTKIIQFYLAMENLEHV